MKAFSVAFTFLAENIFSILDGDHRNKKRQEKDDYHFSLHTVAEIHAEFLNNVAGQDRSYN